MMVKVGFRGSARDGGTSCAAAASCARRSVSWTACQASPADPKSAWPASEVKRMRRLLPLPGILVVLAGTGATARPVALRARRPWYASRPVQRQQPRYRLNSAGQVVGVSYTTSGTRGFLYAGGAMQNVSRTSPTLSITPGRSRGAITRAAMWSRRFSTVAEPSRTWAR